MEISSIFSFLVHPSKNEENQPDIGGAELPLEGNLFQMLFTVFEKANNDCNIEVAFIPTNDEDQTNERRDNIVNLLRNPDINQARILAEHLQFVTTKRSGLGLFFIVLGKVSDNERVYISRFPADFGIVAEERQGGLNVELIERVFMKNAASYKAVVFDGNNYDSDFWTGQAIDKQINNKSVSISGYWIRDFLMADIYPFIIRYLPQHNEK